MLLHAACGVRQVRQGLRRAYPEIIDFLRGTAAPQEVFLHTVLVNSGRFSLSPDYMRYIDWTGCPHTHPRTLGTRGLPAVLGSGAHWARKLDLRRNPALFDPLGRRGAADAGRRHASGGCTLS